MDLGKCKGGTSAASTGGTQVREQIMYTDLDQIRGHGRRVVTLKCAHTTWVKKIPFNRNGNSLYSAKQHAEGGGGLQKGSVRGGTKKSCGQGASRVR